MPSKYWGAFHTELQSFVEVSPSGLARFDSAPSCFTESTKTKQLSEDLIKKEPNFDLLSPSMAVPRQTPQAKGKTHASSMPDTISHDSRVQQACIQTMSYVPSATDKTETAVDVSSLSAPGLRRFESIVGRNAGFGHLAEELDEQIKNEEDCLAPDEMNFSGDLRDMISPTEFELTFDMELPSPTNSFRTSSPTRAPTPHFFSPSPSSSQHIAPTHDLPTLRSPQLDAHQHQRAGLHDRCSLVAGPPAPANVSFFDLEREMPHSIAPHDDLKTPIARIRSCASAHHFGPQPAPSIGVYSAFDDRDTKDGIIRFRPVRSTFGTPGHERKMADPISIPQQDCDSATESDEDDSGRMMTRPHTFDNGLLARQSSRSSGLSPMMSSIEFGQADDDDRTMPSLPPFDLSLISASKGSSIDDLSEITCSFRNSSSTSSTTKTISSFFHATRSASNALDPHSDDDLITIGIYTKAERRRKILRFREKRDRRSFTKKVMYRCRKKFADARPRVGGRFVSSEKIAEFKQEPKRGRGRPKGSTGKKKQTQKISSRKKAVSRQEQTEATAGKSLDNEDAAPFSPRRRAAQRSISIS